VVRVRWTIIHWGLEIQWKCWQKPVFFIKVGGWSLSSDYVVGEFLRGSQRVRLENCSSVLDTAPIIFYITAAAYDPI